MKLDRWLGVFVALILSVVFMVGANATFSGTGTIRVTSRITNYGLIYIESPCLVYTDGAGLWG